MFDSHGLTAQKPTALQRFLERADVRGTILTLIVLNAVVLGLETSDALMARHGAWLQLLDQAMLSVFVLEIGLRLIAWRTAFFRDPWSVFDFAVVAIALVPAALLAEREADVAKTLALAEKYCIVSKAVKGEGREVHVTARPA